MKKLLNLLLAISVVTAVLLLYRTHMELKYKCDSLAWQVNSDNALVKACLGTSFERTRRDAQKIAELEAKLETLLPETARGN